MAALTIAPTADQPTITSGGLGASILKSALMGGASVGYAREKRSGVAETAVGVAQSSPNSLDLTGSTRYRYPGMHGDFVAPTASNTGGYISTNFKPNGSSQNARYLFAVEFVTSSPQVSIRFNAVATNPRLGRIYVNGLPISTNHPAQTVTATAGAGTEVLFTFPSAAARTIKIIGFNNDEGRFGGVDVATGYTVAKPTAPLGDVLMFLGDSYMGGAGGNASAGANVVETWVWQFADAIGVSNVFADGIGGTGYITDTGGVDNSFDTRAVDIAKSGATMLMVGGGRNDSTGTGVQAILEGIIDAATTAGVSTVYVTNSTADSQTSVQAAVAAAVASRSKTYVGGFSIDALPKIGDGIHMTQTGHATFATNTIAALPATTTPVTPKTTATTWKVRTSATKTLATAWSVRSPTVKTNSTSWAVRSAAAKTATTTWSVRGAATKTNATAWAVRTRTSPKTQANAWSVRNSVTRTLLTTWNVNSSGAITAVTPKTAQAIWAVRIATSKSNSTNWRVRSAVSKTSATSWKVRTIVTRPNATTWAVRQKVATKTTSTSWATVATVVALLLLTRWAARNRVNRALLTTWNVESDQVARDITVTATLAPRNKTASLTSRRYGAHLA